MYRNGGSLPPRLPMLSQVLRAINTNAASPKEQVQEHGVEYTLIALSYRGYWTSQGRPSERGIKLDAAAVLEWVGEHYPDAQRLVLWGQSLGAGVAAAAASAYCKDLEDGAQAKRLKIDMLILETPFTSIRAMLTSLYPQKWLPYRYLHPFLWNHWDSKKALQEISATDGGHLPRILILQGGEDEVVPGELGEELEQVCRDSKLPVERKVVKGALHHEVAAKAQGRKAVAEFIGSIGRGS